ncbi:type VII secretion integral membrane protein EccD [Gordonia caeni]|uniref:Type VII secretion integral membrane protein EccD n=1 Tax=Gordonia caeni TaxID=1007097 RepID=A0ABP7PHF8_9ACTN
MTVTAAGDTRRTAEPELIRVSVLGADTQLDVALPAQAPIVALLPDLLALLRLPAPPTDDPDRIGELPRWTLGRVGEAPLPAEISLAQAGVFDGELLMVREDLPSAPGALVDDVVDGLAHLAGRQSPGWTADSARLLGYAVAVAATSLAVIAGRLAAGSSPVPIAAAAGGAAVLLAAVAILAGRSGTDPRSVTTASTCAFLVAVLAGSAAPQPNSTGPSLAAAGICGLVATMVVYRCTGVGPLLHSALGTVAALGGACGLFTMGLSDDVRAAAAITAALGVYLILLAARVAIAAGRLPLPPVPTTPPPLPSIPDGDAVVDGLDGMVPDRSAPADPVGAIAELALVELDDLARRSAIAAGYLTGIVAGAAAVTVAAVAVVATGYGGSVASLLFCGAVAVALLARGRTHADRTQSATLIGAGAACVLAVLVGTGSLIAAFAGGIALAATAFTIGVTADEHSFSPLQRRALEVAEYAVLVAIIPALLWLLDTYRAIREF